MRKVSASDWIRKSAEYPRGDGLELAPPRVRTPRSRKKAEQGGATPTPEAPMTPPIGDVSSPSNPGRMPPVAAAAGKAKAMRLSGPPVAAAAGLAAASGYINDEDDCVTPSSAIDTELLATTSHRDLEPALREPRAAEQQSAPARERPRSRMQAYVDPEPIRVSRPRPQYEPLPIQLPSRDVVALVTRQRRKGPQRRPKNLLATEGLPVVFLAIALVYALVVGGHFEERGGSLRALVNYASSLVGMSADDVRIIGLDQKTNEDVLAAIGVENGGSLIGFDANEARRKLETLDWVSQASVLRLFPNRLFIELTERHPFALWQSDGVFKVIDKSGIPMPSLDVRAYKTLPIVVGEGANVGAADLVNHLEAQPGLMSLTRAAVRVADRRWVLYLNNSIKVDLPEEKVDEALAQLVTLIERHGIMTRDIVNIDMRLRDRVVVRLSDEAAEKLKASTKSSKPIKVSRSN